MAITVHVADDGAVRVRTPDIGAFVQHFGPRISSKGLLLETQEPLPRGREIELRMGLDEGLDLIEAVAMVAWKRRPAGDQPAAVGLHLLAVTSGAEFIQRLVDERAQGGRPVFDLELASPLSEDGSPIEADQIDRMIARRGDRSVAADLHVEAGDAEPVVEPEAEDAPDFAPGFGKSETWNQKLQAGMPRSVSNWLDGPGRAAPSPQVPQDRAQPAGSAESDSPPSGADASASVEETAGRASDKGAESWRSTSSEVKPPEGYEQLGGPLDRATSLGTEADTSVKRSGPIKVKLPADRQPSRGSASESLSGALESSFVEASRRAESLLRDPSPHETPSSSASAEALSTVVLNPDEMKRVVERVRGRAETEAQAEHPPRSEGQPAEEVGGAVAPSPEPKVPGEELDGPEPSLLNLDRSMLEPAAEAEFGYPREDRTPMIIVGGIVLLIVVGLILWLAFG